MPPRRQHEMVDVEKPQSEVHKCGDSKRDVRADRNAVNYVGQTLDGAAAMVGRLSGVKTRIKAKQGCFDLNHLI